MGRPRKYDSDDPKERHRLAMQRLRERKKAERKIEKEAHPPKIFVTEPKKPSRPTEDPQIKPVCYNCRFFENLCTRRRIIYFLTRPNTVCARFKPKGKDKP